jgi:hypothetical protein
VSIERSLPPGTHRYFWDIDPTELDVTQHPVYVIERLLEHGDLPSARWMLDTFPLETIVQVLQSSRKLSRRSANFWALYLDVDKEEVACLSKPCQREPAAIWPY